MQDLFTRPIFEYNLLIHAIHVTNSFIYYRNTWQTNKY